MFLPHSDPIPLGTFMREYWHRRPLMIPKAFDASTFRIDQTQIFELASSLLFHSRLIEEEVEEQSWDMTSGPFDADELEDLLGLSHWTLLVQDTERVFPQMRRLLEFFQFIPNWRLDDVQLSYASPEGSAGPHVDSYDVFLVQISGTRNWKIESTPIPDDRPMRENLPIQLLESFHPDEEYVVNPGDVLYLPPKIPHWGIALEECITASIGFKIPEETTLDKAFSEIACTFGRTPEKFIDPSKMQTDDPGRIDDSPLDWFQNEVRLLAEDREQLDRIFCAAITNPVRNNWPGGLYNPPSKTRIRRALQRGTHFVRLSPSCMVYREFDDCIRMYALGTEHRLRRDLKPFAQLLTGSERLHFDSLRPYLEDGDALSLLQMLLESQALIGTEEF